MPIKPNKPTHGGKRIGAGKKAPEGVRKARTVKLNEKEYDYIQKTYDGLTKAVRLLLVDMK